MPCPQRGGGAADAKEWERGAGRWLAPTQAAAGTGKNRCSVWAERGNDGKGRTEEEGEGKEGVLPSSSSRRWSRPVGVTFPPPPRPALNGPISSEAPGIMNGLLDTSLAAV